MESDDIIGYIKLRNAIVKKAFQDLNGKVPCYQKSAMRFIVSDWFEELTGLRGVDVLAKLEKE